ncbi:BLUF domain-containing protein [Cryobacterium sp. PH31-L1]|uniref:BLUF domain-containing protein n=1 Tax=Cryobacterium sp. PH31-L1 TaxID=3046199 RepID=UPI0024BA9FF9|nr:BLUF domain-containing protein [Cryobacterium sp. PH31-L1]MDJ0379137.1 BLUF domain-containing protein [Cryobacterium sp. PH31-L1]
MTWSSRWSCRPLFGACSVASSRRVIRNIGRPEDILLSISYVSAAALSLSDQDIVAILVQARANNVAHHLIGALIYHEGRFIQILEGPDDEVRARFAIISADPRHRLTYTVSEEQIASRQFPEWTMGFRPLSDIAVEQLAGYDDIFDGNTGKVHLGKQTAKQRVFLNGSQNIGSRLSRPKRVLIPFLPESCPFGTDKKP